MASFVTKILLRYGLGRTRVPCRDPTASPTPRSAPTRGRSILRGPRDSSDGLAALRRGCCSAPAPIRSRCRPSATWDRCAAAGLAAASPTTPLSRRNWCWRSGASSEVRRCSAPGTSGTCPAATGKSSARCPPLGPVGLSSWNRREGSRTSRKVLKVKQPNHRI